MRNEPSRVAGFGAAFPKAINRASRRQAGSPPLPTQESLPLHAASPCFGKSLLLYGHPTLRDWFISEWSEWEGATSTGKPRGSGERVGRRANQYQKSGKKLDMGKGCVRFKKLDDLALDVVGRTARSRNRSELRACPLKSTWPITGRQGRS